MSFSSPFQLTCIRIYTYYLKNETVVSTSYNFPSCCIVIFYVLHYSNIKPKGGEDMKLGAFSVSLHVKDIHKSKEFYEKLGFQTLGGDITQNWLIMKNETTVIGLSQVMFEKNIFTFNPG